LHCLHDFCSNRISLRLLLSRPRFMSQPLSRVKPLLYSILFILLWIHSVFGDDQSRLDVLQGNDGESSCILKANIYIGCKLSPPSTFNATYETPASCTCNRVFFNIWSACSYSTGENLFPVFKDWMSICSNSGINPEQAQFLADSNTWGVDAPKWARIDVPGNLTMDMQNAVLDTVTRSNWSAIQIVLPFITALVAIFLTVLVMQLYHSRSQSASWRERMRRLVRPIPRVKNVEKYESWEIEANDGGQYELVTPQTGTSDTYAFGPKSSQQMTAQHQPLHQGGHNKTDSETFDGDDGSWGGSLKSMRLPWKKGPTRVQEVHATTEFDIDDYTMASTTDGLASDAGSMHHKRRSEDSISSASQLPPTKPPKDNLSYSDPFSEQKSHR